MTKSCTPIDQTRSTRYFDAVAGDPNPLGDYAQEVDRHRAEHEPVPLWACANCWGPASIGDIYCTPRCADAFRALMVSRLLTWGAR